MRNKHTLDEIETSRVHIINKQATNQSC